MPKILVVDDERGLRISLKAFLNNAGYEVYTVEDGQAAWDYLIQEGLTPEGKVDLVLTDDDMPRIRGSELVRMIRADERFASIPVIMASGDYKNESKALEGGVDHFLEKPFDKNTLLKTVGQYFS